MFLLSLPFLSFCRSSPILCFPFLSNLSNSFQFLSTFFFSLPFPSYHLLRPDCHFQRFLSLHCVFVHLPVLAMSPSWCDITAAEFSWEARCGVSCAFHVRVTCALLVRVKVTFPFAVVSLCHVWWARLNMHAHDAAFFGSRRLAPSTSATLPPCSDGAQGVGRHWGQTCPFSAVAKSLAGQTCAPSRNLKRGEGAKQPELHEKPAENGTRTKRLSKAGPAHPSSV